jgi:hypothetical protein
MNDTVDKFWHLLDVFYFSVNFNPLRTRDFHPLENCSLVVCPKTFICIFNFSTAYNKCTLHDAQTAHTK